MAATRYDLVPGASAAAPGSPVLFTAVPNGNWSGETITLESIAGAGTIRPLSITTTAGSSTALAFIFESSAPGEHYIAARNSGSLRNPYHAPLNVFADCAGRKQVITAAIRTSADLQPHQRDTASGTALGFTFLKQNGFGEVWFGISAISGPTAGLFVKLYDALSEGATVSVGTGTALTTLPVQIYGEISAPAQTSFSSNKWMGGIRVMLPASDYIYFADIATDAAFTNPIRVPQRFSVGHLVAGITRSQHDGLVRQFAEAFGPTGVRYPKTIIAYSGDARFGMNAPSFLRQDGTSRGDPASNRFGYDGGASAGAMEAGRFVSSTMGVALGVVGVFTTALGTDYYINHDGSLTTGFTETIAICQAEKFRWLYGFTSGWEGNVDNAYPVETYAENRTRYLALPPWVAGRYPACAVIGWNTGATGHFGNDGSSPVGFLRNQDVWLSQIEAVDPMCVCLDDYHWSELLVGHGTRSSKKIYVDIGFWSMWLTELAVMGGGQNRDSSPMLSNSGTCSVSAGIIRLPYKLRGGTLLQSARIIQNNDHYTFTVIQGVSAGTDIMGLFAVYPAGGYSGAAGPLGIALALSTAAIDTSSPPAGFDGTIDLKVASGTTIPSNGLTVHFASDFGVSGGAAFRSYYPDTSGIQGYVANILMDNQIAPAGIPFGRHLRPRLGIAVVMKA